MLTKKYYDPVVGRFVSADIKQGNAQGMDPYSYVGNNPETLNDPTGQRFCDPTGKNCGHPCADNCSPGGSGTHPCDASSTHWNGSQCVANPSSGHPCGSGTVLENGKCIADGASKGEQKRQNSLRFLRSESLIMQIAGWILFLVGDYLTFSHSNDAFTKFTALIDGGITIGTNILPLMVELFGSDSLPAWVNGALSAIMGVMSLAEGWITKLRGASWWEKEGVTMASNLVLAGVGGPFAALQTFFFMLFHPLIGNLLDIGGHALLTAGYAQNAQYTAQENMPLQDWCAQNGGCPGDTF